MKAAIVWTYGGAPVVLLSAMQRTSTVIERFSQYAHAR
jgi:hypothetical protein